MCVDAHVPSGAGERFPLSVGNMLLRFGIAVLLGHAKIDDVDHVRTLGPGSANKEIIRFNVPVDQVLLVDCLHPRELDMGQ